ncbi:molybdopterin-dependent oxidoreductase [Geobacillus sp. ZGt-1]|uniref:molybdopterin-dependent oxidoreductase n=1 Tax=Geobacillus sp. ZGt-1 TaxID=1631556 RepID=UPI000649C5C0|nr:molybdopterin-dependent oxidoreductase [Geobacillus sp. ZGt-1]
MAWETPREDMSVYTQGEIDKWVYSTCGICSNGCGCYIAVKDNRIVGIKGNVRYPVNRGRLGPKGENQWWANNSLDRLTRPLIRNRSGTLVPASWNDALSLLVEKTKELLSAHGPESIAVYHSGQLYLEEYYTIAKITRAGLRTHHVDANTRLCTATAEWSLIQSFGADGPPACLDDLDVAEVIVFIGRNSNETNTVLWERVLDARRKRGTKIHPSHVPDADAFVMGFPHETVPRLRLNERDFVVITTHQFERDRELVSLLADMPLAYLGVLGPRRRTDRLFPSGSTPPFVRSPAGLSIGARGPYEIAVSITAELISVLRGRSTERVS